MVRDPPIREWSWPVHGAGTRGCQIVVQGPANSGTRELANACYRDPPFRGWSWPVRGTGTRQFRDEAVALGPGESRPNRGTWTRGAGCLLIRGAMSWLVVQCASRVLVAGDVASPSLVTSPNKSNKTPSPQKSLLREYFSPTKVSSCQSRLPSVSLGSPTTSSEVKATWKP